VYWYRDTGDLLPCDLTADETTTTNRDFVRRCELQKKSIGIEIMGLLHNDIFNVATNLLPGVRVQVKLKKVKPEFNVMNKENDSNVNFRS
jgi:hypothetical protein